MNDLLKLHKVTGGKGTNEFIYKEYLDEHFNTGELNDVLVENNVLGVNPINKHTQLYLMEDKVADSSRYNRKLTFNNVTSASGELGNCLDFSQATNSGIHTPNFMSFNDTEWTIDFWLKLKPSNSPSQIICGDNTSGNANSGFHITISTNILYLYSYDGTTRKMSEITLPSNIDKDFYHFAYVRKNSILYVFMNGTMLHQVDITTKVGKGNDNFYIGRHTSGTSTTALHGYLARFRCTGEALFTSNFDTTNDLYNKFEGYRISPPINLPNDIISSKINWDGEGRLSARNIVNKIPNDVKFYLDSTFGLKDLSDNNISITNYGSSIDDGIVLDGINDYFTVPLNMDYSKEFTIEGVVRVDKTFTHGYSTIFSLGHPTGSVRRNVMLYIGKSNNFLNLEVSSGSSTIVTSSIDFNPFYDKDVHVAITYNLIDFKVFINGNEVIKILKPPSYTVDNSIPLTIGKIRDNAFHMKGCIYKVRVSDICRYDTTFTPILNDYSIIVTPLNKNETIKELPRVFQLKEELEGEETISNVQLDVKHKPKKETIKPSDLIDEGHNLPHVLYDYGVFNVPMSDLKGKGNGGTITRNSDHIYLYGPPGSWIESGVVNSQAMNLADYSYVCIEFMSLRNQYTSYSVGVAFSSNETRPTTFTDNFSARAIAENPTHNTLNTFRAPLSDVLPAGAKWMYVYQVYAGCNIYKIWLEK